jgi:hypothetical protein
MAQQKPKEKAQELYNKFFDYADSNYGTSKFNKNWFGNVLAGERKVRKKSAKECALIAVEEIIPIVNSYENALSASQQSDYLEYWYEVKQEIEKL